MTNTQQIVAAFYTNIEKKDFKAVRSMLHNDLAFESPIKNTDNADDFVTTLERMSRLTEKFRIHHLFVDGERACCVFDLVTATPIGESPVAESFMLRDGRIGAIRAHFDSRPWIALSGPESH